jgi:serine/threonine protein kinase
VIVSEPTYSQVPRLTQYLDHHQLSIILDILGTPTLDDFYAITSSRSREYIRALPFRKKKPFSAIFPKASPAAADLLEKLLTFSPKRRIDVDGALAHPYLESYHDEQDEPSADALDASFFDFENEALTKEDLKGRCFSFFADEHACLILFTALIYEEVINPWRTSDSASADQEMGGP